MFLLLLNVRKLNVCNGYISFLRHLVSKIPHISTTFQMIIPVESKTIFQSSVILVSIPMASILLSRCSQSSNYYQNDVRLHILRFLQFSWQIKIFTFFLNFLIIYSCVIRYRKLYYLASIFSLSTMIKSGLLAVMKWSVCIVKSQELYKSHYQWLLLAGARIILLSLEFSLLHRFPNGYFFQSYLLS